MIYFFLYPLSHRCRMDAAAMGGCTSLNILHLDVVHIVFFLTSENNNWYTFGRGRYRCHRKQDATLLSIWQYGEFNQSYGDDRSTGPNKY